MRKAGLILICTVTVLAVAALLGAVNSSGDHHTASRESAGIAPDPLIETEAIVQVYSARAFGWRGAFGVHTWIATKPSNGPHFTVFEVMGWHIMHGDKALVVSNRPADARWFGSTPEIIADVRGEGVDDIIKRIEAAAISYPYMDEYRLWPGPNSNTFTAYMGRAIPELKLDLPPTAIGKDYLPDDAWVLQAPSGTGYQFSLYGLLGVLVGVEEGLEVNLLGLTFGIDAKNPALKLPFIGRLGFDNG